MNAKQGFILGLLFSCLVLGSAIAASPANEAVKIANKTVNLVKDSSITGYIYTQIALDDQLSQQNIDVSTDKGVVYLSGTVANTEQAQNAVKLAQAISGVKRVESTLKVVTP